MFTSPGAVAFHLGPIEVRYYGVLIGLGILGALFYGAMESKRRGKDPEILYDLGFWVVLGGIVGARLYYVFFNLSYFSAHPADIIAVWKGGLAIHGALIFGFLAFLLYAKKHGIKLLEYMDIITPGIAVAQGIGRWGNFFNSEAFGTPTSLPWKLYIPEGARPLEFINFEYFHPTFLYESIWDLIIFVLLFTLTRRLYPKGGKHAYGLIFFLYISLYSFARFFIEGLRTDSLLLGPFKAAQAVSVFLFIVGAVGLFALTRKRNLSK